METVQQYFPLPRQHRAGVEDEQEPMNHTANRMNTGKKGKNPLLAASNVFIAINRFLTGDRYFNIRSGHNARSITSRSVAYPALLITRPPFLQPGICGAVLP